MRHYTVAAAQLEKEDAVEAAETAKSTAVAAAEAARDEAQGTLVAETKRLTAVAFNCNVRHYSHYNQGGYATSKQPDAGHN